MYLKCDFFFLVGSGGGGIRNHGCVACAAGRGRGQGSTSDDYTKLYCAETATGLSSHYFCNVHYYYYFDLLYSRHMLLVSIACSSKT